MMCHRILLEQIALHNSLAQRKQRLMELKWLIKIGDKSVDDLRTFLNKPIQTIRLDLSSGDDDDNDGAVAGAAVAGDDGGDDGGVVVDVDGVDGGAVVAGDDAWG